MYLKKNPKTQLYFNLKFLNSSTLTFHTEGRRVGGEQLCDTWTETDRSHFQAERREAECRVGTGGRLSPAALWENLCHHVHSL